MSWRPSISLQGLWPQSVVSTRLPEAHGTILLRGVWHWHAGKVPKSWGSAPNKKKIGQRFWDPRNETGNTIRVDKGIPGHPLESQRVEHVRINCGGRVIGRAGQVLSDGQNAEAHIPLDDWLTWTATGIARDGVIDMVKYDMLRSALVVNLRNLADICYQERVWVRHEHEPDYVDSFDEVVHFFFDDTPLADDVAATIGDILQDEREAQAVKRVTHAIDTVLMVYGNDCSDSEYISYPEWGDVIKAAKAALNVIGQ